MSINPFSVTITKDGEVVFRATFLDQASAERFRVGQRLRTGEVMTLEPTIGEPATRRPFVLVNMTEGVVEGIWSYAGTGKPIVRTVDFDRGDEDPEFIVAFCERAKDIADEWEPYITALTDETELASDLGNLFAMREEIDSLLDGAMGTTMIAGVEYDNESGDEAYPL